jgi:hypothetical protein
MSIEERLTYIHGEMTAQKAILERVERRLFGGEGENGEIPSIKARLAKVESWAWRCAGAIGLGIALVKVIGSALMKLLLS